jgi:3-hydroxypropionyl-coenzyme A dehydratase
MIFTGKMISADEADNIGLVNNIVTLTDEDKSKIDSSIDPNNDKEKKIALSKALNDKLLEKSVSLAKEIAKNSFNAVKVSKMLINKGMDADIDTGLRLEIYGWALCFAHEDRQKMMSAFLNKNKK